MFPTRLLTFPLIASFLGCALARNPLLKSCEHDLQLSLHVTNRPPVIGQAFEVTFVLLNAGAQTVEACFGPAYEVTFLNGRDGRGSIVVVDHPTCVQSFTLGPGDKAERVYAARVPVINEGVSNLGGGVEVLDPRHCDRYGCDRTWIKSTNRPQVTVRRAND